MISDQELRRRQRLYDKVQEKWRSEIGQELELLAGRDDFRPEFGYFLDLFRNGFTPDEVAKRTGRPVAALLCLQAPLELFSAFGLQPYKIFSGSQVLGQLAGSRLPALMCPMLRSVMGALELLAEGPGPAAWVVPTTCDWVVKFPEMRSFLGLEDQRPVHWLELPHLKEAPGSQARWLGEVIGLKKFLEELTGQKLKRSKLLATLEEYQRAWRAFSHLVMLKRSGRVPAVWFMLLTNAFFLDTPVNWTRALEKVLPGFEIGEPGHKRIFLAGSPIFFPNFKIAWLLERATLTVAADDLCSSERLFPGQTCCYDDPSEYGLLRALAERYHQGCLCPTFADNQRRINNIKGPAQEGVISGVVFQVLKGCHPYDLESLALEEPLKQAGLRYLKLETDYAAEDSQTLLTRLEAYSHNLEVN